MHSNIITPPDFINDENTQILIIDPDWNDVDTLSLWLQNTAKTYNIYVYTDVMMEPEWLESAIGLAHVIILNTQDSACTPIKNKLIKDSRTWYYGPHRYLGNTRQIADLIEYFKNQ
jgi:hypothetical protein